jgi:hypothetical protein
MKIKNTQKYCKNLLTGSAMVLAITSSVFAQEKPFTQAGTAQPPAPPAPPKKAASATATAAATAPAPEMNPVDKLFNGKIPDAFAKGKFNFNARLRYEFADQDGNPGITDDSHAPTIRTRFGFTSAPVYGFQGMLEGENITVLGREGNYNAAGSNHEPHKPVIADPPTTELNQGWFGYTYTNLLSLKGGRQRIALDNQRFVGDVAWRQNMQTFDAATATVNPLEDLSLFYGYIWDVHRVFGNVPGLPAANRDFVSNSHLINVAYTPFKYGSFVGYSYLLDLKNAAGSANSCATYGGYFAGAAPVTDKLSLGYRAEFAWQTDYAENPASYDATYYNLELSGSTKPLDLGAGYEALGSGSNKNAPGARVGFKTPLATLHAFNGWDDIFLGTPSNGLDDLYAFVQVNIPKVQIPIRFVYHKFDSDSGSSDYGQEFDVVATRKFGKNWLALVKYAYYDGKDAIAGVATYPKDSKVSKFWVEMNFNF